MKQILKRIGTILLILFIPFLVLFIFASKEEAHLIIKSYSPNQQYELKGYQVDTQTTIPNYVVADLYNKKNR